MKHDPEAFAALRRNRPRAAYAVDTVDQIRHFMPMVKRLAWHVHGGGRPGLEVEDLVQVGLIALNECVRRHQGQGEHAFAAYAKTRVRGAMIDLVRKEAPTTRTAARKRREIDGEAGRLAQQLGRPPSEAELADALGIGSVELSSMRAFSAPLRFEPIDDSYSDSNPAFADSGPDGFAMLDDAQMREQLAQAIAALPDRLQLIVQLYFVEELNLSEIAEVLNVSVPRVHQIKAQALSRLRDAMDDAELL